MFIIKIGLLMLSTGKLFRLTHKLTAEMVDQGADHKSFLITIDALD